METPPPLTVGPVARRLQISEDRVRQLADLGLLPSTRTTSGLRLFSAADVEAFAAERRQGHVAQPDK